MASPKNEGLSARDSFNPYDSTEEASEFTLTPDSGVHDLSQMDPHDRAKAIEEWTRDLAKTEEEINTLRQVLSSKIRHMQDLKRKLGITVWKEFREDMEQGIRNIQESTAYQKTSLTLKTATEKTTEALGSIGATMTKKLEEVKQSTAFKNLEEKVGTAYSSVKFDNMIPRKMSLVKKNNSNVHSENPLNEALDNLTWKNPVVYGPFTTAYFILKTKVTGPTRTDEGTSGEALIKNSNESQIPAEKS